MTSEGKGKRPSVKRPSGNKFKKLKEMRCFKYMDRRIRAGYPLIDIARYVQQDREEYTDVKEDSLVAVLSEFREAIPPGEIVAQQMPQAFAKAEKKLEDGIDELTEMADAYRLQKLRVVGFQMQEEDFGLALPNRQLTGDIELLMKMLKVSLDMKMDLGMTKRHLGEMSMESRVFEMAKERFGEKVAKTLSDSQSRRKIISLVDKIKRVSDADEAKQEAEEAS